MGNTTLTSNPFLKPSATAVYRVLNGEPEIVFVCEACDDIYTIGVREAMSNALSAYAKDHRDERHSPAATPSRDGVHDAEASPK